MRKYFIDMQKIDSDSIINMVIEEQLKEVAVVGKLKEVVVVAIHDVLINKILY